MLDYRQVRDPLPVEPILDTRHAVAREAYSRKDIDAYIDLFTVDVEYRRADGSVVDRDRLRRDVKTQFRRLENADTAFVREEISADGGEVTEVLSQTATGEARAFGVVHRFWRLKRRGRYTWVLSDGLWKIARVHVLSEEMRSAGWRLGL